MSDFMSLSLLVSQRFVVLRVAFPCIEGSKVGYTITQHKQ